MGPGPSGLLHLLCEGLGLVPLVPLMESLVSSDGAEESLGCSSWRGVRNKLTPLTHCLKL